MTLLPIVACALLVVFALGPSAHASTTPGMTTPGTPPPGTPPLVTTTQPGDSWFGVVPSEAAAPAHDETPQQSPLNNDPFGDDGVITVAVMGDSLAEGIWGGLFRLLQRDGRFDFLRRAQHSTGLARPDYFDWARVLEQHLSADPIDAVVIAFGLNDHQSLYIEGRFFRFGSERWDEVYRERVRHVMQRLDEADIPTFWVGLPVMRDADYGAMIAHMNTIFEAAAADFFTVYIPTWELTSAEDGSYTPHLADHDGRSRLMRANDGIHFTSRGYELLARRILDQMDLTLSVFAEPEADEAAQGDPNGYGGAGAEVGVEPAAYE